MVGSRQIYGTHYFDASVGLTVLVPDPSSLPPATYVAYMNRSRVDVIGGMFGGVAKKIIASKARSTVGDSLGRLRTRLEREFGIKIPRGELFPEDILTNAQSVQGGKVTAEGIEQLKKRMPFADLTRFAANPAVQDFGNLLTVQDMCRYVESKVAVAG